MHSILSLLWTLCSRRTAPCQRSRLPHARFEAAAVMVPVCFLTNHWCSPPSCANFVVAARQRWRSTIWQSALQLGQWCARIVRSASARCSPSPGFWRDLQASGKILHAGGSVERASPCPQPSARVAASSLRPLTYHSASRPGLALDTQTVKLWHLRVFF